MNNCPEEHVQKHVTDKQQNLTLSLLAALRCLCEYCIWKKKVLSLENEFDYFSVSNPYPWHLKKIWYILMPVCLLLWLEKWSITSHYKSRLVQHRANLNLKCYSFCQCYTHNKGENDKVMHYELIYKEKHHKLTWHLDFGTSELKFTLFFLKFFPILATKRKGKSCKLYCGLYKTPKQYGPSVEAAFDFAVFRSDPERVQSQYHCLPGLWKHNNG